MMKLVDCPIASETIGDRARAGAAHGLVPLQHIDTPMCSVIRPIKSRIACQIKAIGAETTVQTPGQGLASVINLLESPRR
jgi:hypothetical protein